MGSLKKTVAEKELGRFDRASVYFTFALALFGIVISYLYFIRTLGVEELRLSMQDVIQQVEEDDYSGLSEYKAMVADTTGTILYSNIVLYNKGDKVNLHIFSHGGSKKSSRKFVSPIVRGGVMTAILYVEQEEERNMAVPIILIVPILLFSGIMIVAVSRRRFIHNDVIVPIIHLNEMAREIAKGNYKVSYTYETSNEIGRLCRQLEGLRDELDIRTENEKKLLEHEKMLLACISHDLRTPIASISGFAEGIRDKIACDEETTQRYVNTIIKKANLLTKLINDIIENTAGEVGQMKLVLKEMLADKYVEQILTELLPDMEQKGITLIQNKIPNALVIIDPDKMYQVFQNIIGNSIKYTKQGGCITVSGKQREKDVVITIMDNGQGIAAEDIPYVFDKFYRGEKARTQNIGGSGLGLSIVKNIITEQGGEVECESEAGEGTAISFTLLLA